MLLTLLIIHNDTNHTNDNNDNETTTNKNHDHTDIHTTNHDCGFSVCLLFVDFVVMLFVCIYTYI